MKHMLEHQAARRALGDRVRDYTPGRPQREWPPASHFYNELVVEGAGYRRGLPSSVEAFFYPGARSELLPS